MTYYPLVTNSKTELTDIRDYLKANKDIFDKIKPVMYDKTLSSTSTTVNANTENNENIKQTLDVLQKSAQRLKNTYKFNYDMERNQHYATNTLKEQKLVMDDRYDRAVKSIDNNHRKYEIFQYYYLKNKTQLHILYVFLLYLGIMIVWTFIHNNFSLIITDGMYSFGFGLFSVLFFIYVCNRLYDIFRRSEIVFDEYNTTNWNAPPHKDASGNLVVLDKNLDIPLHAQKDLKDCEV